MASSAGLAQTASPSTTRQVTDTAGRIVTAPLRDLNVKKDPIPPVLLAVMDAPYSLTGLTSCAQYKAEIDRLTKVLGPDVDSRQATGASETSTEFVLGTAESVAGSLIPGTGLIRKLSGADAARKHAQAAVLAGQLRRAFLKGRAGGRACKI
ncbi:hypothetical protein [Sandarakinorhabdus glacialis]|uniref:hypothetical protein n=1 Tax=Sandarakinorhabdus glacialis TaxID=1614636 RepID=UPI001667265E|nr:hypothetical protein [Polymorphobacter glacialis]